jgi:hypothetical protein
MYVIFVAGGHTYLPNNFRGWACLCTSLLLLLLLLLLFKILARLSVMCVCVCVCDSRATSKLK